VPDSQTLLEPLGVPSQDRRHVGRHRHGKVDTLGACDLIHQPRHVPDDRARAEGDALQLQLARLDAGEVQHVRNDGQQQLARLVDGLNVVPLLRVERRAAQQLRHAQNTRHGLQSIGADETHDTTR